MKRFYIYNMKKDLKFFHFNEECAVIEIQLHSKEKETKEGVNYFNIGLSNPVVIKELFDEFDKKRESDSHGFITENIYEQQFTNPTYLKNSTFNKLLIKLEKKVEILDKAMGFIFCEFGDIPSDYYEVAELHYALKEAINFSETYYLDEDWFRRWLLK